MNEAIEERAAVVAEGGARVRLDQEVVLGPCVVRIDSLVPPRTFEGDELVATLVYHKAAYLALITLFPKAPNEILAVAAKGRLLEKPRNELVVLDFEDVLLLEGSLARPEPEAQHGLLQAVIVLVGHVQARGTIALPAASTGTRLPSPEDGCSPRRHGHLGGRPKQHALPRLLALRMRSPARETVSRRERATQSDRATMEKE